MLPARWQAAPRGPDMQNAFQSWIGQIVVVQLAFGPAKVSLRGMFLRDQEKTLLMRPEAGPDIEIAKTRVLAIEEVKRRSRSLPWRPFECASPSVGRSR
jgi:hypothetical protein